MEKHLGLKALNQRKGGRERKGERGYIKCVEIMLITVKKSTLIKKLTKI
jgi:hypothetical protein